MLSAVSRNREGKGGKRDQGQAGKTGRQGCSKFRIPSLRLPCQEDLLGCPSLALTPPQSSCVLALRASSWRWRGASTVVTHHLCRSLPLPKVIYSDSLLGKIGTGAELYRDEAQGESEGEKTGKKE